MTKESISHRFRIVVPLLALITAALPAAAECPAGAARTALLQIEHVRGPEAPEERGCWVVARESSGLVDWIFRRSAGLVSNGFTHYEFICGLEPGATIEARITQDCNRQLIEPAGPDHRAVKQLVSDLSGSDAFVADRAGRILHGYTLDEKSAAQLRTHSEALLAAAEGESAFQRSWAALIALNSLELEPAARFPYLLRVVERGYIDEPILSGVLKELERRGDRFADALPALVFALDQLALIPELPEKLLATIDKMSRGQRDIEQPLTDLAQLNDSWSEDPRFQGESAERRDELLSRLNEIICRWRPEAPLEGNMKHFNIGFPPKLLLECGGHRDPEPRRSATASEYGVGYGHGFGSGSKSH